MLEKVIQATAPPRSTMLFRQLFDSESSTYTYLLADEETGDAVLIDAVMDQIERDLQLLEELGLTLRFALDTHVHADHVTAAGALRKRTGASTVVSERGGAPCADRQVKHGDRIAFGRYELEVRETPGHTDGCLTFVTKDHAMAFTGDALLIRGSGRTDFQQGDARRLFASVQSQILSLPDTCLLYPAHDYKGRTVTSVAEEKRHNPRLGGGKTVDEFVVTMESLSLPRPKKIDVAVPANLQCGLPSNPSEVVHVPGRWAPVEMTSGGVPEVPTSWVAAGVGDARVVDVREPDEFVGELGHVQGAILVPLATLPATVAGWSRSAPVVLTCRSGARSGRAALELLGLGFERVASMRGGMIAWNREGAPTVRTT